MFIESGKIKGVSYIGNPKSFTAMFLSKKVDYLLKSLDDVQGCIVFLENTICVPKALNEKHEFRFSDHPQAEYTEYVMKLFSERIEFEKHRKYKLSEYGYYLGENAHIGSNSYIEPGCLIGHDVVIGDNATILANSVIKNCIIGNNVYIGEGSVIGSEGFTLTKDSDDNWIHIPTMGKVVIGDNVDIGINNNISRGTADDTIIEDHVKLDSFVYIGHDAILQNNTEITAGGIIGGYVTAEDKTCIGINATVRNRIRLGTGCMIGMGAVVTKSVDAGTTVVGNPANILKK